jgi:tRNA(fMet)-specific endonuclease VapC
VIARDDLLLLDTNVLIHLIRGKDAGLRMRDELGLVERPERPIISIVTVGEVRALALKFDWGAGKRGALDDLIRQLVIVGIDSDEVLTTYAEIDHYSKKVVKPARPLGQNDIWIAACACVYGGHLLTTDRDFDHLTPKFIQRTRVDGRTGEVL